MVGFFGIRSACNGDITVWKAIMVDLVRKFLGHRRLRPFVLAILATPLLVPAHAEALKHTGGASPHVAPTVHRSAKLAVAHRAPRPAPATARPAVAARSSGGARRALAARRRAAARPAAAAPTTGGARPALAARRNLNAHPAAAPAGPLSQLPRLHPDAWPGRHRAKVAPVARLWSARTVGRPTILGASGPATRLAAAAEFAPAPASVPRPRRTARPHSAAVRRQIVAPRGDREPAEVGASATIATPVSHPTSRSVPPAGAEGAAAGVGTGAPPASAATFLAVTALALLCALLPGLLAHDASSFRSAFFALRPERPG